jgi:hypothetical protein
MRINAQIHLCNRVEIEFGQLDKGKKQILADLGKRAIKPCSPKNSNIFLGICTLIWSITSTKKQVYNLPLLYFIHLE